MDESTRTPPTTIREPKVIVAEGADAKWFLVWAYQAVGASEIDVFNFGGNTDLRMFLATLRQTSGFENVTSLVVARDAENDADGALRSAADALRESGLSAPEKAYEFCDGSPRTAVAVFPGFSDAGASCGLANGRLEDLCLATVASDPLFDCVGDFVACARRNHEPVSREWKTRLHAYLAAKQKFVGLKIGEATKAGAWDFQHPAMANLVGLIGQM